MDHILLLEHQYSSLKHCNPGVAKFRSVNSSHIVIAISTIASLALFISLSMRISLSSTLSARLLAVGSFLMTKKVLSVLSNIIFLFLAADYCCFTISASPSDVAACEPGDGQPEQAHHHQEADQCATQQFVSYSVRSPHHKNQSSVPDNCTHPGKENHVENRSNLGMSDDTTPFERLDEDVPVSSKLDLVMLDEEADSITLETVVIAEPTSRTTPELEKLHIDELNKKFEEFIRSKRIKWVEEQEASLQWQEKGDNKSSAVLAC